MKQIFQDFRTGKLVVEDVPPPMCEENGLLVSNSFSIISTGTEKTTVNTAKKSLIGKARARPDLVRKTLNVVKEQGVSTAISRVRSQLDQLKPLGYSSAGQVIQVGKNCSDYSVGDWVACGGGGYANHAEYVYVPKNLCAKIPSGVEVKEAAFATLGAIAIQGIRQSEIVLGESVAVIGLGLIGQLTVQLLKSAGCKVVGVDYDEGRLAVADDSGCDYVTSPDNAYEEVFRRFRSGIDAVIVTASTKSNDPIDLAGKILRDRGRVVIVGDVGMQVDRSIFYEKELDIRLSRSYGPGRYDVNYEEKGQDYPIGYIRWPEQRNMEAFLSLLEEGKIQTKHLTTHEFNIEDALAAYELFSGGMKGERFLAVTLAYNAPVDVPKIVRVNESKRSIDSKNRIRVGFFGAGNFAQGILLPNLKNDKRVCFRTVVTQSGGTSFKAARKFNFEYCSTEWKQLLEDDAIDAVFVATRHDLHAKLCSEVIKSGKAVFVEKPLALNAEQLNLLSEDREKYGGAIMVGFNRRFSPMVNFTKKKVESHGESISIIYRVNAGSISKDHWIQDLEQGGGRIIGEVCHFIDTLSYIGGSLPVSVFAQHIRNSPSSVVEQDTVHIIVCLQNGSVGTIVYSAVGDRSLPKEYIEVSSSNVNIVINDFKTLHVYENGRDRKMRVSSGKGHKEELRAFIDSLAKNIDLPISFEESVHVTITTFAINESLQTGKCVAVLNR